ncbi:long-chain acyl-CoA synthetase [Dongia mobilis]|uniref:Long-chain acyl-CoA synthetase n=1 Tax=Dongia mobilis TaxID=578943 RepID=A0A4R6WXW0_9PROT|nr:long-chain fatty acid--CoA ligase [Dongia mobilis]TDQ84547.1 long-chain acyl-CoA synthetase [Dongia mobilis]
MDYDRIPSLPRLFFDQAQALGDKPLTYQRRDGSWHSLSWREISGQVRALARGLVALGIQPGDRVALVAENRPEWLVADLAIMSAGAITVPAFTTNTTEDHRHILTHSGARGMISAGETIAKRLLPAALHADIQFHIAIDPAEKPAQLPFRQIGWQEALALSSDDAELDRRLAALTRRDTSCIIYTSGTGGVPKGVMLSHGSIMANIKGAYRLLLDVGLGHDRFLSFLPLSHSYEHTAGQFLPISIGAEIWYAESVEKLVDNMAEARPTIMTAVPRLYEAMHAKILRGLEKAPKARQKLFWLAYRLGRKKYEKPAEMTLADNFLNLVCEVLVRRKVRKRFGGHLKAFVSGGAALNYEIGVFFLALGVRLLQGYGQTEASPVISANMPSRIKIETVGPIFDGLEAKIAEDGEILVRGEAVMNGYWRDPESTAKTVVGGWLHTGDIGEFDADGYLKITDRKKDIIVLSGGDNVSPARVEGFLALQPEIAQAMVHGDKHPHLVALVVPDADFARDWAAANKASGEIADLADNAAFHKAMAAVIDRVNTSLSPIEKIRRFALLGEGFTIENAMLTPSLKIRRHKIRERWGHVIGRLYDRG